MGYFDFLIDKKNKQPKVDMEYIYLLDEVWKPNELGSIPIKKGTIMIKVVQLDNKSYEFICKDTGEKYHTNYAWSLAENTPENLKRIEIYENEYRKLKDFESVVDSLRDNISTLK